MFEPVLLAILTFFAILGGGLLLFRIVKRTYTVEKQRILSALHAYIEKPDADNPIAQLTGMIATQFSNIIVHHISQSARGVASGDSRQEKAVEAAIVHDLVAEANPLMGMAMNTMPWLSKLTRKNPELVALAAQKLGPMLKQKSGDGSEPNEPTPFEFQIK